MISILKGNRVLISHTAAVEEAHAEQTAVIGVETKVAQDSDPGSIWAVEKREDDPNSGGIWAVEKRAAQRPQPRFNLGDEKGAQATAKSKQLKRARYAIPQPWRLYV